MIATSQGSRGSRPENGRDRIVVIGLDAFDPDFFERMIALGRAPFLASLADRGVHGRLASTYGLFSDSPWPSLTSGVSPAKHAFFNYIQIVRGTLDLVRVDARHCRYLPFWSLLAGTGKKVATLDVPKTFPVEGVEGIQVCAWGEHYPLLRTPASLPVNLSSELVDRYGAYPHPDEIITPSRGQEAEILRTLRENVDRHWGATDDLFARDDWDLFMSVASEVHYAGHQFHHLADETHWAHEPEAPAELRDALPNIVERTDRALERFFERLPADATWFVVSVHGMTANYSANHLMEEVLARLGFFTPAARPRPTNRVGALLRGTRRARALIPRGVREFLNDRLVPDSVHDRALSSSFGGGADWERTRAFFFYSDHFQAFLNANLRGREPHGTVSPGAGLDALQEELRVELGRLENVDTGGPVVKDVVRVADVYDGPNLHLLPDFVVQWAQGDPIERVRHPRVGVISGAGFDLRKSQHGPDGFLVAGGRHIDSACRLELATTLDLAPTLLHLMGRPVPQEIEGRVLTELLRGEPRRRTPVRSSDPALLDRMRNPAFEGDGAGVPGRGPRDARS